MSGKWILLVLMVGFFWTFSASSENRFSLPPNKTNITNCQDAVLAQHPGEITSEKMIHLANGRLEIHFEIHDNEYKDWLVICDETTGKVLKSTNFDDER